jgi:hypothetical protein
MAGMIYEYVGGTKTGGGGGGLTVYDSYSDLPDPTTSSGVMAYTANDDGGYFSWKSLKRVWEWPRGIYISNGTEWNLYTQQVRLAEDSGTLINIANYSEWLTVNEDVQQYAIKQFNQVLYRNKTGAYTSTEPFDDTVNWEVVSSGGGISSLQLKQLMCG